MSFTPDYQRIADDIRDKIRTGQLRPGDKLPTKRQMCELYGTSQQPVESALFMLRTEGLVRGHQGKGVYVVDPDQEEKGPEGA